MENRHDHPTDSSDDLRHGSLEVSDVSIEQIKAIVVKVTERVLEQAFDPGAPTIKGVRHDDAAGKDGGGKILEIVNAGELTASTSPLDRR